MSARRSFYAIHRWAGVLVGFAALVVLFTGAVAVFSATLSDWAQPEPARRGLSELARSGDLDSVIAEFWLPRDAEREGKIALFQEASGDVRLTLTPGPERETVVQHVDASGRVLHIASGQAPDVFAPRTASAVLERFWVRLHVSFLIPGKPGVWLTGIAAMAMLLLAASGIYVYWPSRKRMFRRPRTGKFRTLTGDLHTLLGAWTLPFTALAGLTGMFFSFATSLLLPVLAIVYFEGDVESALKSVAPSAPVAESSQVASLASILNDASRRSGHPPQFASIEPSPEGGGLLVSVSTEQPGWALSRQLRLYNGHSGDFIRRAGSVGQVPSLGGLILSAAHGLHYGTLAGLWTQLIWFVFGLATCVVAGGGLCLWTLREPGARSARAIAAASLGLPLTFAVTLIVWSLAVTGGGVGSQGTLAIAFFGTLLLCAVVGFASGGTHIVRGLLGTSAGAFLLIPVAGSLATGSPPWRSDAALAVDLFAALFAIGAAVLALRAGRFAVRSGSALTRKNPSRGALSRSLVCVGIFTGSLVASIGTAIGLVEVLPTGPAGVDHFLIALAVFPVAWLAWTLAGIGIGLAWAGRAVRSRPEARAVSIPHASKPG
ncbi:MAG: PepSY-associated TM helix domain-containing protein [Myxococcota bacterium]